MPEHVHLLVLPLAASSRASRLLAKAKQPTSKAIKRILQDCRSRLLPDLTVKERPGKTCFRFWQEGGGFDRNMFSGQALESRLDYIHTNPVKRGLCNQATDWKWSSARFLIEGRTDPDLPESIRPEPRWFESAGVQQEHG